MVRFEEFMEKANKATNTAELFETFRETVKLHGFDRIMFCLMTDHKDIDLNAGFGVIQNYPQDWMQYYFEQGFDKIDPVATYGVNQVGTFTWAEIPQRLQLTQKQFKCLNLGIEAGLNNGICTPLRGPNGQMAGIGLATSEKNDACNANADLMTAYCNHFYLAYKRLHDPRPINPHNIILTKKEEEVLTWAAIGKSDDDIGTILTMSKHTVNMHFRNIFTKLDANNRVLAVVKALSMGLIHP